MNFGSLLHGSSRPASPTGRTIGTPRRYDFITAAAVRRPAPPSRFARWRPSAGVRAGDRILDVGCGTGYFVRMLAEIVGPDGAVVGIDASPEMIAYASSRSRSEANVSFKVGSAGALSFPDSSFDVVVSSLTMHHLAPADQLPAIQEMRRVLRPGGTLLIAEFQAPTGHGWRLLLGPTGLTAMGHAVPHVEGMVAMTGFARSSAATCRPSSSTYARRSRRSDRSGRADLGAIAALAPAGRAFQECEQGHLVRPEPPSPDCVLDIERAFKRSIQICVDHRGVHVSAPANGSRVPQLVRDAVDGGQHVSLGLALGLESCEIA